jgi:predicted amidohydrolase
MTANKNFKRRVRARALKTGESYTAALRHFQRFPSGESMPNTDPIRIAAAQLDTPSDPSAAAALHRAGREIRQLMSRAHEQGARLIHFCEGAICAPNKRIMSSNPSTVAEADWTRMGWEAQQAELRLIAEHAASLQLWTVVGAVHRLTAPHRPYNSLYVIGNHGRVVTRYDERMLSNTKVSYMYTPGTRPITFDVDGVRFGCALGMESVYPELFLDYERADVHCVLLSTQGPGASFALQAQGHASSNSYWISYATCAADAHVAPSGIVGPDGAWWARCAATGAAAVAIADIDREHENLARPWRRTARGDRYAAAAANEDPRTRRDSF